MTNFKKNNTTPFISTTCAIYVRTATDNTASLEEQKAILTQYAEDQGYAVQQIYSDIDSGLSLNRPALQKLFHDLNTQQIKTILVKDYSRLSRKTENVYALKAILQKRNVKIVSLV
jgi:site-specific DNA recombinase